MPVHTEPHPLAGKTIKVKADVKHFQFANFGGMEVLVEDWADRVFDDSWKRKAARGNPGAYVYSLRVMQNKLPDDDEVVYVKGGLSHLVHVSELDITNGE